MSFECPRGYAVRTRSMLEADVVMNCIKEHRKEGKIPQNSEGCSGCSEYPHKWDSEEKRVPKP